jgi:xanthine dehydrogenase YagS FAD-binding subunit
VIPFDYRRAVDLDGAVADAAGRGSVAYLAGGTNLVDRMKLGVTSPEVLIDITGLPLDGVEELPGGGLRIGATVRNSDLAAHPVVRRDHPVLSRALLSGASGQLRTLATTGGNLLQRTRCSYFQDRSTPCGKREPGDGCSAIGGHTRQHAVLGASEHCVAVHPSDMAVAMAALDAVVHVQGPHGAKSIPAAELHRLPGDDPSHDTVLDHGDLITAVDLPRTPMAARSTYLKVRDRASFAFALVSVAAALELAGDGTVVDVRLAFGGVAHKPWRAVVAEEALRGQQPTDDVVRAAADAELDAADPLEGIPSGNGFKIPMARNTLLAAVRDLTAGRDRTGERR